jgi:coproporphyrinogen III oxidase
MDISEKQTLASQWFYELRDKVCSEFEDIEREYALKFGGNAGEFKRTDWLRSEGGGGTMSLMRGQLFEKVGVNVSIVHGEFSEKFRKDIPNAQDNPNFWASGISLVSHMRSPLIPAVHMNTRMIVTQDSWFGGGADLTPYVYCDKDKDNFHKAFKDACDKHDASYYEKFKKWCDEYFYLKHREEPRGIGGIFYDYLNSGNWDNDFAFTKDVGKALLFIYPEIVRSHMFDVWTQEQKKQQLIKRGRYVEFNLLYDRGTKFGLETNGNTEAILMSMPPEVIWP